MKTLIIQTAFLGDVVLTLPLIQAIKKNLKSEISVLCIPATKNILEGHPDISEIIVYDKKGKDKGIFSLFRLSRELKAKKFDVVLVPHPSFKSGLIAYISNIPKRVGFSNSAGKFFFTDWITFNKNKHQLERHLDLMQYFDIISGNEKTQIYIGKEDEKYAESILNRQDKIFGINPGSVWATKRWLPERYAELSDRIIKMFGAKIIIFGSDNDIGVAREVENNMKEKPINLAGKTTLKQLSALIKKCKVFITNDSGAMHIAAVLDVPTVAIFGPTVKKLGFFPFSEKAVVIEKNISCRPCGKHGPKKCPKKHFKCMKEISVSEVFECIRKFYENKDGYND
ncbi:MAG: lipopolysaccharide heptosyltransferase II [Elusimicrobia bacterium RIFOXYC2_FULL_34_12]|nr:MAG: lipopolysaccharide heptosyltransferase II [Elusimicrobia bacterium RIFOXYC2_FULL_34_12]OGS38880.1 MAG: lipopolysaccharide heptosyltransferase II [Elusimicrobia bacterium RIFOXYD2_FULL_34_30]HAM39048.1 lipopolysaccharide heptosyltransferase II [Elusimicrobiota bacterium]